MSAMERINIAKLERIYPDAYIDIAPGCVEPGYDDAPVILADWNRIPDRVFQALERAGFLCEWLDEWITCSECGKAFRVVPDCYHWQMAGIIGDGEARCLDCIDPEEYMESIENNPRKALTLPVLERYAPEDYGYTLVKKGYENGMFEGQSDDPRMILKAAREKDPKGRYLFAMTDQGQFDIEFALYVKDVEEVEEEV